MKENKIPGAQNGSVSIHLALCFLATQVNRGKNNPHLTDDVVVLA